MTAVDRERRRRRRRRKGLIVLGVEVPEAALELALARAGFISTALPATREDLSAALARVLSIWIKEENTRVLRVKP